MPKGSNEPKAVITDDTRTTRVKPEQTSIPGTEQDRIPAIERAADKYDEKKRLWSGLGLEMKTAKAKLVEELHANRDAIVNKDGDGTVAYVRGDYNIVLETTETLKVKISGNDESGGDE